MRHIRDTSFSLILLLYRIGFTGDEVSVLSSISATLATDATHLGNGGASFSLISGLDLSLISIELDKSVSGSLSYSSLLCSIIGSRVATASVPFSGSALTDEDVTSDVRLPL
ncbi:MAG: hypothetical protein WBQ25_01975 [Nitrososphaeraceae archaeon]